MKWLGLSSFFKKRPSNPVLDGLDMIESVLIMGVGVNATVAAGQAAFPLLKLPIISSLWKWLVSWICGKFHSETQGMVNAAVIKLQNAAEKKAYDKAVVDFKAALAKQDANATSEARKQYEADFDKLISLNK